MYDLSNLSIEVTAAELAYRHPAALAHAVRDDALRTRRRRRHRRTAGQLG